MAKYTLIADPPLAGYDERFGDMHLVASPHVALVSVALPLGGETAAIDAFTSGYGTDLPSVGTSALSEDGKARIMRLAQDQAFVMFTHETPDAADIVAERLQNTAYVTDQTDVWTALRLSGASCKSALERICPIDLDPSAFGPNHVARTIMEHLGTVILRESEDSFVLLSASSSAGSFLHAVETSIRNVI